MRIRITQNINYEKSKKDMPIRIAAYRDGGLGDALFAYATICAIRKEFPLASIDMFSCDSVFNTIFDKQDICKYQLIEFEDSIKLSKKWKETYGIFYYLRPMSMVFYSGIILSEMHKSKLISNSIEFQKKIYGNILYESAQNGNGFPGVPFLEDIYAGDYITNIINIPIDIYDCKNIINKIIDKSYTININTYITVHQGATSQCVQHIKFWNLEEWKLLINNIKEVFPDISIVQIGGAGELLIPGVDVNLVGQISLEQSISVMQNGLLHIDIEGSLVHIAHIIEHNTISLCGPTMKYWRHYSSNTVKYIEPQKNVCKYMPCETIIGGSMDTCIIGSQACMNSLSHKDIFNYAKKIIEDGMNDEI